MHKNEFQVSKWSSVDMKGVGSKLKIGMDFLSWDPQHWPLGIFIYTTCMPQLIGYYMMAILTVAQFSYITLVKWDYYYYYTLRILSGDGEVSSRCIAGMRSFTANAWTMLSSLFFISPTCWCFATVCWFTLSKTMVYPCNAKKVDEYIFCGRPWWILN